MCVHMCTSHCLCVCARARALGSVDCCCEVAVMNLPAGWPLTPTLRGWVGRQWGDNGEDGEREKGAPVEEQSRCDEMD